jgi:hypothetical protein
MAIITAEEFSNSNAAARLVAEGRLVRLARGIYSDDVRTPVETLVEQNWKRIVGYEMPGAVITDRSAFDMGPRNQTLYVAHSRQSELVLPGLTVIPSGRTSPATDTDIPLGDGIFAVSEARGLLDNMKPSRARGGRMPRTLTRDELHDKIVRITRGRNSDQLARVMNAVDELAGKRNQQDNAASIRVFLESARGARPTVKTGSRALKAAQSGSPYDSNRVLLFEQIAQDLRDLPPNNLYAPTRGKKQDLLPFFEAYFSNFIEGTEFTVEEAAKIALAGEIPADRPADAHDIAGTFRVVNDPTEMELDLPTADDFIDALRRRHKSVMEGRPEKNPGEFKTVANRAGSTEFVAPTEVEGTLRAGWSLLKTITDPFARATFVMFFVSEVHPFDDGNGRSARIMMNGELAKEGRSRIIIPTIIRSDYLSGLVRATANGNISGLVSVLSHAQKWAYQIPFESMASAMPVLDGTNAFLTSQEASDEGLYLELPERTGFGRLESYSGHGPIPVQGRVSKGIPAGGQFRDQTHTEADITLG